MHDDFSNLPPSASAQPNPPTPAFDQNCGIDIRQRAIGEIILVETDNGIYELVVVAPSQCLVKVTGTDPRLHQPAVGRFLNSTSVLYPYKVCPAWIGLGCRMLIAFRNANFESGVILSASIRGNGWHFDVF